VTAPGWPHTKLDANSYRLNVTSSTSPGFFDAVSGGPLSGVARDALLHGVDLAWAHPGRLHHPGRVANKLLNAARESCAKTLGFSANEIVFTQSVPLAFRLALGGLVKSNSRVVASAVEQSYLLNDLAALPNERLSLIGVDSSGRINTNEFQLAVSGSKSGEPVVAVLQIANHEVGTRQPCEEIDLGPIGGVSWLADATLSAALEPIPQRVDVAVVNPASWGGPLGVGLLCIRNRVSFSLPLGIGDQARDGASLQRLLGEPNVGLALACAAGLEDVASRRAQIRAELETLARHLRDRLASDVKDVVLLGATEDIHTTPGLVSFSLLYVDGEALLSELAKFDVAVTSGSSCVTDAIGPSHVLIAMGALSQGNIRVSIPIGATLAEIDQLADQIAAAAKRLRANSGLEGL
jgi:cysteine desulfurase